MALHVDGVILLLQYLFIHRSHNKVCPHCAIPLHGNSDEDAFRRRYSARVGQWWRRSVIDTRSYITATRTAESKYEEGESDEKSSSVAESTPPPPRPSMVQSELPDAPFLPQLALRVQESARTDTPTSQWSNPQDLRSVKTPSLSSPYRILFRKSREAMNPKQESSNLAIPPLPTSPPFSQTGQIVYDEINNFSLPVIQSQRPRPAASSARFEPPPVGQAVGPSTAGSLSTRKLNSTSPAPARSRTISGGKRQSRTTLLWPMADSPRNSLGTQISLRTVAEQFEENVPGPEMKRTQSLRYYI